MFLIFTEVWYITAETGGKSLLLLSQFFWSGSGATGSVSLQSATFLTTGFGSRHVRYYFDLPRIRIWMVPPFLYLSDPDLGGPPISVPIGSGSGRDRHFCTYRIRIWTGPPFLYLSDPDLDWPVISWPPDQDLADGVRHFGAPRVRIRTVPSFLVLI